MARPQTMTELNPPRHGKPGTYRSMHQGTYRSYHAQNKDQALIQFKADQEQRLEWNCGFVRTRCRTNPFFSIFPPAYPATSASNPSKRP